jgi:hypothetical protein
MNTLALLDKLTRDNAMNAARTLMASGAAPAFISQAVKLARTANRSMIRHLKEGR